jgi:hypothetical protein
MTELEVNDFLLHLAFDNGYLLPRQTEANPARWKAICRFLATWAILTGDVGDRVTVGDRWCYHTLVDALHAFEAWDGTGEPEGWHRHPYSGRRRDPDTGEEWVNP